MGNRNRRLLDIAPGLADAYLSTTDEYPPPSLILAVRVGYRDPRIARRLDAYGVRVGNQTDAGFAAVCLADLAASGEIAPHHRPGEPWTRPGNPVPDWLAAEAGAVQRSGEWYVA